MINYRDTYKKAAYRESFLYIIETVLILMLFTFKLIFFYDYIGIGRFTPVMCAATLAIIMSFYFIIMKLTHLNPVTSLKFIYTVVCIFLFIDRVYYSYLHKMPSFAAVKVANQLTGIPGMVKQLVTLNHAAYIIDLPLWMLFSIDFKKHIFSKLAIKETAGRVIRYVQLFTASFVALCFVFVGATLVRDDFQLSY
jgi:hypothetical protein